MGADGFVDKNIDPVEFLQSLRRAADHEMVLSGPASGSFGRIAEGIDRRRDVELRAHRSRAAGPGRGGGGAHGTGDRARLGVRERTVTTHLARIYGKLGVGTRLAAIRLATQSGLVSAGTRE